MISALLLLLALGQSPAPQYGPNLPPGYQSRFPAAAAPVPTPAPAASPPLPQYGPAVPPKAGTRQDAASDSRMLTPAAIYDLVLMNLKEIDKRYHHETRFISCWPYEPGEWENLRNCLKFWLNSISNRRTLVPLYEAPGLGWYIRLSDGDWSFDTWEALGKNDPYFVVSTVDEKYKVQRGWLDPDTEYKVRTLTGSSHAVVRADRLIGLTSVDKGFEDVSGFYSTFLRLPGSEDELFKQLGVNEQFLKDNALLRGGAVLEGASIVARHNRELQLLPTAIGLDDQFEWRSLDTKTSLKDQSVINNFLGTIRIDGGEHIFSLRNGLHGYYLNNAQKKQVGQVPDGIAQDRQDPHDTRVITPYKCVSCHGPQGGIRHFDDAIARMALNKDVGLSVITKGKYGDGELKRALEDYYLSPLGRRIAAQQQAYTRTILDLNGLSVGANTANYLKFVRSYYYDPIDMARASIELGVEQSQLRFYLKQTGSPEALQLPAGEPLSRFVFESVYADIMRARIYPWERSPQDVPKPITQHEQTTPVRPADKPVQPVQAAVQPGAAPGMPQPLDLSRAVRSPAAPSRQPVSNPPPVPPDEPKPKPQSRTQFKPPAWPAARPTPSKPLSSGHRYNPVVRPLALRR